MTVKDQPDEQENSGAINTVDTPGPQEITPPPEAIIASQVPVDTDEVAVPVVVEEFSAAGIDPLADPSASQNSTNSTEQGQPPPKFCTVISPSTLEAGYSFPAKVDGIDFLVTVPEGGVREGQAFQVPYPKKPTTESGRAVRIEPLSIEQSTGPIQGEEDDVMGRWREPLCECCEVCCPSGMCCYGFFCTPIILAQVMTRLRLNAIGVRGQDSLRHHTFWWVLSFWILFLILFFGFITVEAVWIVVLCIFGVYHTIASTNVRSTMRRRYNIHSECCICCDGVFDDCCTSFWCAPCSVIQMARHTHDIHKYPYDGCSKTGGTPEIV
jgi:Cys-rich protein (TIGR01571 family)